MIRTLTKDLFKKIIYDRPAQIRHLQKPEPAFIADLLHRNYDVMDYIDKSWLTLEVLEKYCKPMTLKEKKETGYHGYHTFYTYEKVIRCFRDDIRTKISLDLLKKMCINSPAAVLSFPEIATYDMILGYVNHPNVNPSYEDIPERFRTEPMLAALLTARVSYSNIIPDEAYTDGIVDLALSLNAEILNQIPIRFITLARVQKAFQTTLRELTRDIPAEALTPDLVTQIVSFEGFGGNISHLPKELRTKADCLIAVKDDGMNICYVPKPLVDEEMLLIALSTKSFLSNKFEFIPPLLREQIKKSNKFLFTIAQIDASSSEKHCIGIENCRVIRPILPETWVKVLEICPKALYLIEKTDQTDAMINAFFQNASLETIDHLHPKVNLQRLKAEHVPFLMGTTVPLFKDFITRKMQRKPKKNNSKEALKVAAKIESGNVEMGDSVAVELTDGEFLELTKKYKVV